MDLDKIFDEVSKDFIRKLAKSYSEDSQVCMELEASLHHHNEKLPPGVQANEYSFSSDLNEDQIEIVDAYKSIIKFIG